MDNLAIPRAAQKPVAWAGMVLTAIPVVLSAMEPALPAALAQWMPAPTADVIVAAIGGLVTVLSAQAQTNSSAGARAPGAIAPEA